MYQALYRKYRPRRFEDVVGQEHVTETLRRQVETGRTSHAYIFVGTRGTGKTTCAKILSRALNCEHPVNGDPCNECEACRGIESGGVMDVVEIDAASNSGVDNIRSIKEEAIYTPADVKKRVYILDEAHNLSPPAFNALLKILEEPPEHLVFILATTALNKIPATILSRCQHFTFRRITPEKIAGRLKYVASQEGFTLTDGAAALLSRLADGSMRDALSLLDQCVSSGTVDERAVNEAVGLMGTEDTLALWRSLRTGDAPGTLEVFSRVYYGGAEPMTVLGDLLGLVRDMLTVRVAPRGGEALLTGALGPEDLARMSAGIDARRLLAAAEAIQDAADALRDARDKRVRTELCLMKVMTVLSGGYTQTESFTPPPAAVPEVKREPEAGRAPTPVQSPPEEDAPPPWEDADIPPETAEIPEPVPERKPAPEPVPIREPEPEPVRETPPENPPENPPEASAEPGGDWWERVLDGCGDGAKTAMPFLRAPGNVAPDLEGSALILRVRNDFVKMMVSASGVLAELSRSATRVLGRSVNAAVSVGLPETPPAAGKGSKLDELAKFDGIVKFK